MKALVLALLLLPAAALADAASDMASVVNGFYGAYSGFHPSDGIPDAKGRAKYSPFISPALEALLSDGDRAEARFAKANKDSPPLIEGDLFTSNFEGATAYRVETCSASGRRGSCAVMLTYDPGKTNNAKDKPFSWTDTVYLVQTPAGWRVDDIGYGGTWDFGNKGKMSDTLKSAIADAGN
ncbi:MAG: hypothetical protein JO261_09375 [Alphaproteobacteria bacterium]|nr:hypothetical protein [Alphaproteobacteria bacterium]MBV9693901.1 hypothetical protein [Alphaproteobacteria bacterium]